MLLGPSRRLLAVGLLPQGLGLAHASVQIRVDHHQAKNLRTLALRQFNDQSSRSQSGIGTIDGQQNLLEHGDNAFR
jgi:hypothetical protein